MTTFDVPEEVVLEATERVIKIGIKFDDCSVCGWPVTAFLVQAGVHTLRSEPYCMNKSCPNHNAVDRVSERCAALCKWCKNPTGLYAMYPLVRSGVSVPTNVRLCANPECWMFRNPVSRGFRLGDHSHNSPLIRGS